MNIYTCLSFNKSFNNKEIDHYKQSHKKSKNDNEGDPIITRFKGFLLFTSLFFLFPAGLAIQHTRSFYLAILYTLTSLASLNYWRNPVYGFRRNIDIIVARTSFVITLISGIIFIKNITYLVIGWFLAVCIPICYYLSHKLSNMRMKQWCVAHMMRHTFVAAGMT